MYIDSSNYLNRIIRIQLMKISLIQQIQETVQALLWPLKDEVRLSLMQN